MVAKTEAQVSIGDTVKLGLALILLVAGVGGYYYYADESDLYRVLALLAVVAVALAIAYQSLPGRRIWGFMSDARTEVRKVVWPTRQETLQTTLIVIILVVVVGLFLWGLDAMLSWGFRLLAGIGG